MEQTTINAASDAGAKLAEYGPTGVAIGALIIVAVLGYLFLKAVTQQASEHRDAMREQHAAMKDVIDRNTSALTKNAEATSALSASLPHVCRFSK
jgi:hypothetical protein